MRASRPRLTTSIARRRCRAPERTRRSARAGELFAAKGIDRDDDAARRIHDRDNLRFYGAPVAMIFHVAGNAEAGTFLDMGMFVQNVMLGLVAFGLGSCRSTASPAMASPSARSSVSQRIGSSSAACPWATRTARAA